MRNSGVSAVSESQEKNVFDDTSVSNEEPDGYPRVDYFEVTVEVVSPTGKSFTSPYMILEEQILNSSEPIRMLLEVMTRDMAVIATSAVSDAQNNR